MPMALPTLGSTPFGTNKLLLANTVKNKEVCKDIPGKCDKKKTFHSNSHIRQSQIQDAEE